MATLVLTDTADAGRADAERRSGRAAATRVAVDPTINQAAPGLAEFARALAEGRLADASRIADRLAADPPSDAAAAAEVGAAEIPGPVRDIVCQRIRALRAAFPAFGSVFARLLAAFGCDAGPAVTTTVPGATTTTGLSPTTTVAPPTTSVGGTTMPPGPTTTLPFCGPILPTTTFPPTTVPCIPATTSTSTTAAPTTTSTP